MIVEQEYTVLKDSWQDDSTMGVSGLNFMIRASLKGSVSPKVSVAGYHYVSMKGTCLMTLWMGTLFDSLLGEYWWHGLPLGWQWWFDIQLGEH